MKVVRGTSAVEVNSSCAVGMSICLTIDCQTSPCEGSLGVLGSPLIPSTARTVSLLGGRLRPNKNHGWRTVAGNVCSRCVDDVCQINFGKELLDQLLAELPLHERVGRNHANVASAAVVVLNNGKVKEPLGERNAKRILADGKSSTDLDMLGSGSCP